MDQVERTVLLDAAPEDVWRAVSDERELAEWFGGDVALDATPGGTGRFDEPGEAPRRAVVEEVDEGRRLVWRWWQDGASPASRVELTVERVAGGTRLTVVEAPVAAAPLAGGGGGVRAARAAAWERRLLALELRCLVPALA